MPDITITSSRLRSILLNTQLQSTDNALYQFLLSLILAVEGAQNNITNINKGSTTITNVTQIFTGGIPGISGDDGDDGFIGPPGIQGPQGITGAQGVVGSPVFALDGEDGIDGINVPVPGPQGTQGIQGVIGPAGTTIYPFDSDDPDILLVPGPIGPQGVTGAQGLPGFTFLDYHDDGEDGLIGPPGPQGPAGSSGTSVVNVTTIILTDAQLRALNGTPIQVIPAQGAGIVIVPELFIAAVNVTTGFSAGQTVSIRWIGQTTLCLPPGISLSINSIAKRIGMSNSPGAAVLLNGTTSTYENVGIEVLGSATPTGGASHGGTAITVAWTTITIP